MLEPSNKWSTILTFGLIQRIKLVPYNGERKNGCHFYIGTFYKSCREKTLLNRKEFNHSSVSKHDLMTRPPFSSIQWIYCGVNLIIDWLVFLTVLLSFSSRIPSCPRNLVPTEMNVNLPDFDDLLLCPLALSFEEKIILTNWFLLSRTRLSSDMWRASLFLSINRFCKRGVKYWVSLMPYFRAQDLNPSDGNLPSVKLVTALDNTMSCSCKQQ